MKRILNINEWTRKDHYNFFKDFDDPYFGICSEVDCTLAYKKVKELKVSFFLYYLHKSLKAANEINEFRYRIEDKKIIVYDIINASPTIKRKDNTFGFSYIDYIENFEEFVISAKTSIKKTQLERGLKPAIKNENVIHYSEIPWIKFTAVKYPLNSPQNDSIPKITFGKDFIRNNQRLMPISIHVNHALMDGFHLGKYLELFQKLLNE